MASLTSTPAVGQRLDAPAHAGARALGTTRAERRAPGALVLLDLATAIVVLVAGLGAAAVRAAPAVALVGAGAWCLGLAATGAYRSLSRWASIRGVARAGVAAGLGAWLSDAVVDPPLTTAQEVGLLAVLVLAAGVARLLPPAARLRVVLVGDPDDLGPVMAELARDTRRWEVTAACTPGDTAAAPSEAPVPDLAPVPWWTGPDAAAEAARATGAQGAVIVPGRSLDPFAVRRLSWALHAAGLDVFVDTGLLDAIPARVEHISAGSVGLARLRSRTAPSATRTIKHAMDRAVAAAALVITLPLLLLLALLIRWDSPGKALFRQQRIGLDGRRFTMYKFRTMSVDADLRRHELADRNECDGVLFKMRGDPRITAVGRFLRRYSLDELPQLINVVRGEMSLIGPRPALPTEVARYDLDPRRRLSVRPGLTGLWQVSGRSDLPWEECVRLDLHYVDNWSWGLDASIVVRTVRAVLGHRGAY